jgi:hypothetical protein
MVFSTTFSNISVICGVSFIGGGSQSARSKPPTRRKLHNVHIKYTGKKMAYKS